MIPDGTPKEAGAAEPGAVEKEVLVEIGLFAGAKARSLRFSV